MPDRERGGGDRLTTGLTILLGALASFGPLSIDMYLPALPELGTALDASPSAVQLTLTACTVGLGVGQLVAGSLSDVFGRRRPLLIGVTVFTVFSVACALAPTLPLLVLFRFLQALGGSAGIVISRAIARDLRSGAALARLFSILMVVNGAAPILAPLIGGQLARFTSWRGVFVVLAAIGLILVVASARVAPETLSAARRVPGSLGVTFAVYRKLLRDREFMLHVLTGALAFATMFAYISGSPFVMEDVYGMSPQVFSLAFGVNSAGIIAFSLTNRVMSSYAAIRVGLGLIAAGALTVAAAGLFHGSVWLVLAGFFAVTAGFGSTAPNTAALALSDHPDMAGSAAAVYGAAQFVLGGLLGPLAGIGSGRSALPLGLVLVGIATAATGIGLAAVRSTKR